MADENAAANHASHHLCDAMRGAGGRWAFHGSGPRSMVGRDVPNHLAVCAADGYVPPGISRLHRLALRRTRALGAVSSDARGRRSTMVYGRGKRSLLRWDRAGARLPVAESTIRNALWPRVVS